MALPNFSRLNLKQECHEVPTNVCMGKRAVQKRSLALNVMMADGLNQLGNGEVWPPETRKRAAEEVEALVTEIANDKAPSVEREQLIEVFNAVFDGLLEKNRTTFPLEKRHKFFRIIICETKTNLVTTLGGILNEKDPGGDDTESEDHYNLKLAAILLLRNLCATKQGMTVWLWTLCQVEPSVMPVLANVIKNDIALNGHEIGICANDACHLLMAMTDIKYSFASTKRLHDDITLEGSDAYLKFHNIDKQDHTAPMRANVDSLAKVEGFVEMILNVTKRSQFKIISPTYLSGDTNGERWWQLLCNIAKVRCIGLEFSVSSIQSGPITRSQTKIDKHPTKRIKTLTNSDFDHKDTDFLEEFVKCEAIKKAVTLLETHERNLATVKAISLFLAALMDCAAKEVVKFGKSTLAQQMHSNMDRFLKEKDVRFRSYEHEKNGDRWHFWVLMLAISNIQRSYKEYHIRRNSDDVNVSFATDVPEGMLAYKIWTTSEWQERMVRSIINGRDDHYYNEVVRTLGNILFKTDQKAYPLVWSDLTKDRGSVYTFNDYHDLNQGLNTFMVNGAAGLGTRHDSLIYYLESTFDNFELCDKLITNMSLRWMTDVLDYFFEKLGDEDVFEGIGFAYFKILKLAVLHGVVWEHFLDKIVLMIHNGKSEEPRVQEMKKHLGEYVVLCKASTLGDHASPRAAVWMIRGAIKNHAVVRETRALTEDESASLKKYQTLYMDCWNSIPRIHENCESKLKDAIDKEMNKLNMLVYWAKIGNPMFDESKKSWLEQEKAMERGIKRDAETQLGLFGKYSVTHLLFSEHARAGANGRLH